MDSSNRRWKNEVYKKRLCLFTITALSILVTSCTTDRSSTMNFEQTTELKSKQETTVDTKIITEEKNCTKINLPNGDILSIEKNRVDDDVYGTGQLDNRWSLSEIDSILTSIKGTWEIDEYVGFIDSSIYDPELFDKHNNLKQSIKEELYNNYKKSIQDAKENIPELCFSIKQYEHYSGTKNTSNNYIYTNAYPSPISIILSLDKMDDNYPIFRDRTTVSTDFSMDYPVIYIKFFISSTDNDQIEIYKPATLVLSDDYKFYILIDGAFYSLKNLE